MFRFPPSALGLAVLICAPIFTAHASLVTYTSRTAWTAAVSGVTAIDFEGIAPAAGSVQYPAGLTIAGVTFTDAAGQLYVFDAAYAPGNTNWGSGASLITNPSSDPVTVNLPGAVTAVGVDVFTVNPQALTLQVVLGGPPQPVATSVNPTLSFIGFTSTTAITSIVFFAPGSAVGMDNFSFGTAGAVPEPGSMGMVALALAAYAWRRASTAWAGR